MLACPPGVFQMFGEPEESASAAKASARAGAKTVTLDGSGHWWMLQDPARAATVLREFWATLA